MVGLQVDSDFLSFAADIIGCRVESLTFKYLGLPLNTKGAKVVDWNPVIQKVKKRLSLWKSSVLSILGHVLLIKSTLASISIYYMSLFVMSMKVRINLEKHMCRFLSSRKDSSFHPWQNFPRMLFVHLGKKGDWI